ncbi:quinon protein alcohol dehydrogenase-like superfamily [Aspergillus spectabilis]
MSEPRAVKRKAEEMETPLNDIPREKSCDNCWMDWCCYNQGLEIINLRAPDPVGAFALSPDSKFVARAVETADKVVIRILTLTTYYHVEQFVANAKTAHHLLFTFGTAGSAAYTIVLAADHRVWVWRLDDGGRRVGTDGGQDVDIDLVSASFNRKIATELVHQRGWEEDGVAVTGLQREMRIALETAFNRHYPFNRPVMEGTFIEASPDGSFMICANTIAQHIPHHGYNHPLTIWDLDTLKVRHRLPCPTRLIKWATVSGDSKLIASADNARSVMIWNACTGVCVNEIVLPEVQDNKGGTFSSDSRYIALTSVFPDRKFSISVYDRSTKGFISRFPITTHGSLPAVQWNLDGTLLAIGGSHFIYLWDPFQDKSRMKWEVPPDQRGPGGDFYITAIQFVDEGEKMMFHTSSAWTGVYNFLTFKVHQYIGTSPGKSAMACAEDSTFFVVQGQHILQVWPLHWTSA